jgi:polysaccharide pyruvyl transferase WcaK-like protein
MARKSIVILGTPVDSGNRGVMALGASLVNLCATACEGAEITLLLVTSNNTTVPFLVGGKSKLFPLVHARMSPKAKFSEHLLVIVVMSLVYRVLPMEFIRKWICATFPWIRTIIEAELVGDIRGGDSFSDIYGVRNFLSGFLPPLTVVLLRGRITHFPQTYGPYKSKIARSLAAFLLKRSTSVIARDTQSQMVAKSLVGGGEVLLSPDVAFSLEAKPPVDFEIVQPGDSPIIGVNVNGLMFNGGYTRRNMFGLEMNYPEFVRTLIQRLLGEFPGEIWLIPHTYAPLGHVESDNEAAEKVKAGLHSDLQNRVKIIHRQYDQYELKWIIGQCEFFVGSRMHSCIAALSQGIPCVGVAYSMKFEGVFASVGMQSWIVDGKVTKEVDAVEKVLALYRSRDSVRIQLKENVSQAKQKLTETFTALLGNLPLSKSPTTTRRSLQELEITSTK